MIRNVILLFKNEPNENSKGKRRSSAVAPISSHKVSDFIRILEMFHQLIITIRIIAEEDENIRLLF